jgi:predicted amidohydrolase
MSSLRIALAQCRQTADFDTNAATIFPMIDEAARRRVQVLYPQSNTTRANDWKVSVHHAMIVTRAAENTVWFASCNACLVPHQNSRSLVVAPDGQIWAQTELWREELLVTDLDVAAQPGPCSSSSGAGGPTCCSGAPSGRRSSRPRAR